METLTMNQIKEKGGSRIEVSLNLQQYLQSGTYGFTTLMIQCQLIIKHTPNLTGTKDAYYPNQKVKNYYKSWNPNN